MPSLFFQPPLTVSVSSSLLLHQVPRPTPLLKQHHTLSSNFCFTQPLPHHHRNWVAGTITHYSSTPLCERARCFFCWLCLRSLVWLSSARASEWLSAGVGCHLREGSVLLQVTSFLVWWSQGRASIEPKWGSRLTETWPQKCRIINPFNHIICQSKSPGQPKLTGWRNWLHPGRRGSKVKWQRMCWPDQEEFVDIFCNPVTV